MEDVQKLATTDGDREKVILLLKAAKMAFNNVPDPYYDQRFEEVYDLLRQACQSIIYANMAKV